MVQSPARKPDRYQTICAGFHFWQGKTIGSRSCHSFFTGRKRRKTLQPWGEIAETQGSRSRCQICKKCYRHTASRAHPHIKASAQLGHFCLWARGRLLPIVSFRSKQNQLQSATPGEVKTGSGCGLCEGIRKQICDFGPFLPFSPSSGLTRRSRSKCREFYTLRGFCGMDAWTNAASPILPEARRSLSAHR